MVGANFDLKTLKETARNIVASSTVKLVGDTAEATTFVGSGVIVEPQKGKDEFVVLTAAHNLEVFNKSQKKGATIPPKFDTTLFMKNVKITGSGIATPVPITEIRLLKAKDSETGLDLCLIKATSKGIATKVSPLTPFQNLSKYGINPKAVGPQLVTSLMSPKGQPTFLNVGFGAKTLGGGPTANSEIQYRSVGFKDAKYLDRSKEGYLNLFVLTASKQSSTAPGDSGGPLFVIFDDDVALLAVTLGADYFADKSIESPNSVENNAFTGVLGQALTW